MNWTAISKLKDVEQVCEAISELDVNEQDERGRTPLMLFLTNRMPIEGIHCLLKRKPDLEAEDKLGDTALIKAVKFKQVEAIQLLIEYGVRLDSPISIQASAWHVARRHPEIADMLLDTQGAVRLRLTTSEQVMVDEILYEESPQIAASKVRALQSAVLLHAVVNSYNWDDSPEAMIAACEHPECAEITRLDMAELLDVGYWLAMNEDEVNKIDDGPAYRQLAEQLHRHVLANQRLDT